jgi:hypothetical protein
MVQCGTSVISELTQWSGSLTCLASDLGQARQKYVCTIPFLGGLHQKAATKIRETCEKNMCTPSNLIEATNSIVTAYQ